MAEKDNELHGVGGWLALLVAGMVVIGPLTSISRTYANFAAAEHEYPALTQVAEWTTYKTFEWIAILVFCIISIYGGLGLATKRTPEVVSNAKLVLWFNYPIFVIVSGMIIPAMMISGSGHDVAMAIPEVIASLIGVWIWTAYLNRSKRVRNTYGFADHYPSQDASTMNYETTVASFKSNTTATQLQSAAVATNSSQRSVFENFHIVVDEDKIYADIADELETGNTDKSLWTRLFAETDGDERRMKALYIKKRAERFISAEKLRLEQEHAALKQPDEVESLDESQIQPLIQEEAQPIKQLTPKEIKDREAIRDRLAESIRLNKIQNANSANSSSTQQKYDQETINLIKKYVRTIEARNATYETYDRFLYLIGGNIEAKGFLFGSYHIVTYKGFKTRMNNFLDIISYFETNVLPDFKDLQNLDAKS